MRDLSGALAAHPGAKQRTYVCAHQAVAFLPNAGRKAGSMAVGEELSPTLKTDHNPAVLCVTDSGSNAAIGEDLAPTLTAHEGKSTNYVFSGQNSARAGLSLDADTSPTLSTTKQPSVSTQNVVRRLTPTECERLQGFPDRWTDVPYRGKEHAPDSPRYKALGNSMAVPVMAWIGRRIQQTEEAAS